MKSVSHEQALIFSFRNEPTFGVEYLKDVLKGGFTEELCIAIHRLDEAWSAIAWEHENAAPILQEGSGENQSLGGTSEEAP